MEIETFYDPATSTLTYLVWARATRDAVVIDPVMDFDPASGAISQGSFERLAERVRRLELTVHYSLETHAHADHLSAAQLVKKAFGAKVAIGERIREVQAVFAPVFGLPAAFPADGSQFDRLLADGEMVKAGALEVKVIATPGHTPACVSYVIGDAVFTGDALFVEDSGTGRCDFPRGSAEALYRSVHDRLYALPPETRVFVGHDYQPGGRALVYETTIGGERERNSQLRAETSAEDYAAMRNARDKTLAAPRLLLPSVQVNIDAGRLPPADEMGRRFLRIPLKLSGT
jgi:glyoxylase-like metal-dependent hydrolase (beta-lactamase superfamily II)